MSEHDEVPDFLPNEVIDEDVEARTKRLIAAVEHNGRLAEGWRRRAAVAESDAGRTAHELAAERERHDANLATERSRTDAAVALAMNVRAWFVAVVAFEIARVVLPFLTSP